MAPPVGVPMAVRSPMSAQWWASSRSPCTVPAGLVAVSSAERSATVVTVPRSVGGTEPSDTDGAGTAAAADTTAGAAVAETAGAGTAAVAATTDGVATVAVEVVGAGTVAVAATTIGEAAEPALVDGAGTDVLADTTGGVAVASVPPAGFSSNAAHCHDGVPVGASRLNVTDVPLGVVLAALRATRPEMTPPVLNVDSSSVLEGVPRTLASTAATNPREASTELV